MSQRLGSVLQLCNFTYFSQTLRNEYRYYVLILQIRKSGFKDLINLPSSYSFSVVEELVFKTISDKSRAEASTQRAILPDKEEVI